MYKIKTSLKVTLKQVGVNHNRRKVTTKSRYCASWYSWTGCLWYDFRSRISAAAFL